MVVGTAPETHPLRAPTLGEARETQFRLMECVCAHFDGAQLLQADYGNVPGLGRPRTTARVEAVLADFFGASACVLVQGSGTGAIRSMLAAALRPTEKLVVHAGAPYATTRTSFSAMSLDLVEVDYNEPSDLDALLDGLRGVGWAYVQHPRHDIEDSYDPGAVIRRLRAAGLRVLTDDNYTVFKVPRTGVELGADATAFSLFKMLGPEGVGCVVGAEDIVDRIHEDNYSGGGQVQGPQALDGLRSLVLAPVLWAVQAEVVDEVANRLSSGEVPGIATAKVVNAQDRMILVLTEEPIAQRVVELSRQFGGQNYPVGANSRYEIAPFIYRLSGANLESRPELADYAVRVNPVRAGSDLVISILRRSIEAAKK
ncbi:aminotransferase class V-fold PLP-dependent enzyme [Georgenia sp. AZ-5]|uniref:aminotransferase class V-fold PLP-dependent enzyme n=1 Tax=Georgenia sp. AZ-5 TaxID=3367526 RepID=UPI0037550D07